MRQWREDGPRQSADRISSGELSAWQSFGIVGALNFSNWPHDVQPLTRATK
ncbi:MAG: hypothetical protein WDN29_11730 [Methylovirgula sp.]